jgi:hypothetical protein
MSKPATSVDLQDPSLKIMNAKEGWEVAQVVECLPDTQFIL